MKFPAYLWVTQTFETKLTQIILHQTYYYNIIQYFNYILVKLLI